MLDFNATTDHAIDLPAGRDDRVERARVMLLALGDDMIEALQRLDGERGAALGCALRDFVLSGEVAPAHWPLDKAIEILSRDPGERRTAAVLGAVLRLRAVVALRTLLPLRLADGQLRWGEDVCWDGSRYHVDIDT